MNYGLGYSGEEKELITDTRGKTLEVEGIYRAWITSIPSLEEVLEIHSICDGTFYANTLIFIDGLDDPDRSLTWEYSVCRDSQEDEDYEFEYLGVRETLPEYFL